MTEIRKGWIVFCEIPNSYSFFLKKGFSHAYCLFNTGENWLEISAYKNGLGFNILPFRHDYDLISRTIRYSRTSAIVNIETTLMNDVNLIKNPLKMMNCINFVTYAFGIKTGCITPYQLYRSFRKQFYTSKYKYGINSINLMFLR